jgi:type I restriction enzyme, S subunit
MDKKKLPEGWKEVELGKLFEFQSKSKIKAGQGLKKGKYRFFTSSNKQTKFIDEYNQDGEYLIFATGGHAGIHYCNEKFATSTDCFVVKVNNLVLTKHVYYYLLDKIQLLEDGFKGAGLKHISKGYIQDIKLFYPEDKEIQKKIVSILEKAEKAKEWRKEADGLTNDFLKSVFLEMFRKEKFETTKIKDVIKKIINDNPSRDYPDKEFEYIDISSIDNNKGKIISSKKMLGKDAPSRAKQKVKFNDLIISTVRPNLNSVALIPKNLDNQICSTGFCVLRANTEKVSPEFLFHVSRSSKFIGSMVKIAKGASYPAVSDRDIKNYEVPLPQIELQNKFAEIVKQVEAIKQQQQQSKHQLDNLFNALMQKAFKGELR